MVKDTPVLAIVEEWSFPTYTRDSKPNSDFSLPGSLLLRNTASEVLREISDYTDAYLYYLAATYLPLALERDPTFGLKRNTRDFRCLWCSGVLPLWCSVPVFESGFVVPLLECGHGSGPRVAAGMARGSAVRGPGGRGGFSFLTGSGCGRGLCEAGREYGDLRFPGDGLLGRGGVPEFRAGFPGAL
jgi:hypothetical protein